MATAIRERLDATTNAGTAVDVQLPAVKPGQQLHVSHLGLANASGESVTLQLGITSLGIFTQVWAQQTVATNDAFGVLLHLTLLEGDRLTARVKGTVNKGPVTFVVAGRLEDATDCGPA